MTVFFDIAYPEAAEPETTAPRRSLVREIREGLGYVLRHPYMRPMFSLALKEIIDARVWGGIHFRTADVQGTVIGKKVAHWERKQYFQPVG